MAAKTNKKTGRGAGHYNAQRLRTERNKVQALRKALANKEKWAPGFKIEGEGVHMRVVPVEPGEPRGMSMRAAVHKIKRYWTPPTKPQA